MFNKEQWFEEFVAYFRPLGFFSKKRDSSVEELRQWFFDAIEREWGGRIEELAGTRQEADIFALCCDPARVFSVAADGVYPGEDAYRQIIERCAMLLPTVFQPSQIKEQWSEDENAHVSFTAAGKAYRFISNGPKYIDAAIVHEINRAVRDSQYRFIVSDELGMPNIFMVFERGQIAGLIQARKWSIWNEHEVLTS